MGVHQHSEVSSSIFQMAMHKRSQVWWNYRSCRKRRHLACHSCLGRHWQSREQWDSPSLPLLWLKGEDGPWESSREWSPAEEQGLQHPKTGNLWERRAVIRKMCYNWNSEKFGFPRLRFLMRYFLCHLSINLDPKNAAMPSVGTVNSQVSCPV